MGVKVTFVSLLAIGLFLVPCLSQPGTTERTGKLLGKLRFDSSKIKSRVVQWQILISSLKRTVGKKYFI